MELRLGAHSALMRARASAQGTAAEAPERSASRRRRSSRFHASETLASSLPSRLSINVAATAERSSAGRPSTSSKKVVYANIHVSSV